MVARQGKESSETSGTEIAKGGEGDRRESDRAVSDFTGRPLLSASFSGKPYLFLKFYGISSGSSVRI